MMLDKPASIDIDWPVPDKVKVISTTRTGGYSASPYDSFNLALHTNDKPADVLKNRARLAECFELPSAPVWLNQVHGSDVLWLDENINLTPKIVDADASWTQQSDHVCAVMTADCLPVFISNTEGTVVGVAHGGWKGLLAGVITRTVNTMGLTAKDALIFLGPAIGAEAFVVGDEVLNFFRNKDSAYQTAFEAAGANLWHCDLYQLARIELALSGIEQVYGGGLCTYSDAERFYSYRRDGENTGRLAHLIWLASND